MPFIFQGSIYIYIRHIGNALSVCNLEYVIPCADHIRYVPFTIVS